MTYIPGVKYKEIGNLFGIRTWGQLFLFLIRKSSLVDKLLVSADKLLKRTSLLKIKDFPGVEYGLKPSKNELGWADFRVTNYSQIQKWWEIVMSAYLMVSLHCAPLRGSGSPDRLNQSLSSVPEKFQRHELWDFNKGWKNHLNNLHLIIQPFLYFGLIKRWLKVFPIPQLSLGFPRLISIMNLFDLCDFTSYFSDSCYRSSA